MKLEGWPGRDFIVGSEKLNDESIKMDSGLYLNERPFDISKYEFSDSIGVGTVQPGERGDLVVNLNKGSWIHMDEQDAEAIAKHFKLI